ncbi:ATP-dependent RNA helicase HAS1 [Acrasis kona]|uniref:ATP-dependent RNA helicase n=1 Tax=Acrasis kona TaxID=1008807 RepID=A0AAW2Z8Y2_9EUKA
MQHEGANVKNTPKRRPYRKPKKAVQADTTAPNNANTPIVLNTTETNTTNQTAVQSTNGKSTKKRKRRPSNGDSKQKIQTEEDSDEDVQMSGTQVKKFGKAFESLLEIPKELRDALAEEFEFDEMTPIQKASIPAALGNPNQDILAQARTGSGKTLSFLIPIIVNIITKKSKTLTAVVLAPTRELVLQIESVAQKIIKNKSLSSFRIKVGVIMGGGNKTKEANMLDAGINLLIASPGRLLDHLNDRPQMFKDVANLVLDEADMLMQTGFEHDIKKIASKVPQNRSTYLFSATMDKKVLETCRICLSKNALQIGMTESTHVDTLEQTYAKVHARQKLSSIISILRSNKDKKIILFVAVKKAVNVISDILTLMKIKNTPLHGNMSQTKRTQTFFDFMKDTNPGVLVATDIAARGLDFPNVDLIIQCDMPDAVAQYFHRAGRTARGGKTGTAVIVLSEAEQRATLPRLLAKLNEVSSDKTLSEFPMSSNQEIDRIHEELRSVISRSPALIETVDLMVHIYQLWFNINLKQFNLRANDFDAVAMRESFGVGSDVPLSKINKHPGRGGGKFKKRK